MKCQDSYLGPANSNKEVETMAKRYKAIFQRFSNFDDLSDKVASLLTEGNV